MDANLLFQACGAPTCILLALAAVLSSVIAVFLFAKVNDRQLLGAFFPFTFAPVAIGATATFIQLLSSIGVVLGGDETLQVDSGLALLISFTPFFAGCVAAVPAASICAAGVWALAWRASGARLFPESAQPIEPHDQTPLRDETNAYLDQLAKSRQST